jgi:hypothetical protein
MPELASQVNRQNLVANLWPADPSPSRKTWVLLDGARDARIYGAIRKSYQVSCCLFAGELSSQLKEAAPYLVQLDPEDQLTKFVLDNGWGHAWGVFLRSSASLEPLRRHFRKFLRVSDETGRHLLFRYYDPRVLSVYLPTCYPDELTTFFGPVDRFAMEAESGTRLEQYRFTGWKLAREQTDLTSGG